ncbi:MAG: tol-pal system protein YbgF [Methylovulum sp.]|nr:tol-pal system protein YbgF [Methylovulum sp.]
MNAYLAALALAVTCSLSNNTYALPEVIDNSAYPVSAGAVAIVPVSPSPSTNSLMEMTERLEQLQLEVQQLTGKVEEQANQIAELKQQQAATLSAEAEKHSSPPTDALQSGSENSVTEQQTSPPSLDDEASSHASPAGTATTTESVNAQSQANRPLKTDISAVTDDEKKAYFEAYETLRLGHTDEAIMAFKTFINNYAHSVLISNAQYWLAEAYRVNQNDDAAKQIYELVVNNYPGTEKMPDALLKLAYVEINLKHNDQAKAYLTRVIKDYPETTLARLAAKKLLTLEVSIH